MKDMTDRELLDAIDSAMKAVAERFGAGRAGGGGATGTGGCAGQLIVRGLDDRIIRAPKERAARARMISVALV